MEDKTKEVIETGKYRSYSYKIFSDRVEFKLNENDPCGLEDLSDLKIASTKEGIKTTKKIIEGLIDAFSWRYCGEKDGYKISIRFTAKINREEHPEHTGNLIVQILKCSGDRQRAIFLPGLPDPITAINYAHFMVEKNKNSNWF